MNERGRKPKGNYKQKTHVFSTRITADLREELVAASKKSGHSLSQEVEHRLRRSFGNDREVTSIFGNRRNYAVLRMISCLMELVYNPDKPNAEWVNDPFTFDQLLKTIAEVLQQFRPPGDPHAPPDIDPLGRDIRENQYHFHASDWLNALKQAPDALPIQKQQLPLQGENDRLRRVHMFNYTAPQIRADLGDVVERIEVDQESTVKEEIDREKPKRKKRARRKPQARREQMQ